MEIKIVVAAHKEYRMPNDSMYIPIHVGHALAKQEYSWQGDDTGDNISQKNPNYCELTALYWAWKNLDADAIGLVHYRRHFLRPNIRKLEKIRILTGLCHKELKWDSIIAKQEVEKILNKYPVIVPTKRHYYIETVESQYTHAHHQQDLDVVRMVLEKNQKKYLETFNKHMKERSTHIYNMFIMRKEYFDKYCSWLFDILFEVEKKLDISNYSKNDARVFGFLGERLLDIWLEANKIKYFENKIICIEKQNWIKKCLFFLLRKYKLYEII